MGMVRHGHSSLRHPAGCRAARPPGDFGYVSELCDLAPTLTPGSRVGPYDVGPLRGAGGMGEVYRAHDTRLHREVALKVLPESFALDPERLARFKREAQVLAALSHPHIAAIYGLEEFDGVHALVLELVEGATLADRLTTGPLPVDEALADRSLWRWRQPTIKASSTAI